LPNRLSEREHLEFARRKFQEGKDAGVIVRWPREWVQAGKRPHCILPLAVAESSSGKKRLILDARVVNLFVQYQRFHYEKLGQLLGNAQQGGFLTLKDLSAG
jgi:hypothetical protein